MDTTHTHTQKKKFIREVINSTNTQHTHTFFWYTQTHTHRHAHTHSLLFFS